VSRLAAAALVLLLPSCGVMGAGGASPPGSGCPRAARQVPGDPFASWTVVDLTHVLDAEIPYWPGTKYFPFECWDLARFEEVRAYSRAYRVPEHYGTHVDAPNHFAEGQAAVDAVPADRFVGPAVVFDLRARAGADPDATLTAEDVDAWEAAHGRVPEGAIAFLLTGWSARWKDPAGYRNFDAEGRLRFPSYGVDAARRLLVDRGCRGLCVDALSVDRGLDDEFPVHRLGSGLGRWFAENLANLERLPPSGAWVVMAPIPLRGGSGAQVRALAFLPPAR
jgi:kynurenine formamidase